MNENNIILKYTSTAGFVNEGDMGYTFADDSNYTIREIHQSFGVMYNITRADGSRIGHIRSNFADFGLSGYTSLPLTSEPLINYNNEFAVNWPQFGTWENGEQFFIDQGGFTLPNWSAVYLFPHVLTGSSLYQRVARDMNSGFCHLGPPTYGEITCYKFVDGAQRSQCMPIVRTSTTIQVV